MTCAHCHRRYTSSAQRCPHCGKANPATGVFQTSTVMVASSEADGFYRSVDDVPASLRTKLLKSTNGANSATILIADRRGREEIARAMRALPSPLQRRLMNAVMGSDVVAGARLWLTPARRMAVGALLLVLVALTLAAVFLRP
jgi:hypothetical protein